MARGFAGLGLLLLAACADSSAESGSTTAAFVATNSILGDIVANLVGDNASVEVLIPAGTDPHEFQPSIRQAELLREADLVVAVGTPLDFRLGYGAFGGPDKNPTGEFARVVHIAEFLQRHLPLAREKPVEKDFCGIWMRRLVHQAKRAAARRETRSFFPVIGVEVVHRQALVLRAHGILAAHADGEFSLGKPVGHLAEVFCVGHIHGSEKFSHEKIIHNRFMYRFACKHASF